MTRYQELIRQFRIELECRKYAQSSIDTYSSCLGVFLKAMNGKQKPLPLEDIKVFLGKISNVNYHKQFTATIHHFYKLVVKQPLTLDDIPYPRPTNYLPEIFSVQEISRLVASYTNLKHRAIIQLMYSCGLRIGEVINIEIGHIQTDRSLLRVAGAKGFKDRDVPLPSDTITLLKSYYIAEKNKPRKWLFEGQYAEQYSVRSIQQVFWQGVNRLGIEPKPHHFRPPPTIPQPLTHTKSSIKNHGHFHAMPQKIRATGRRQQAPHPVHITRRPQYWRHPTPHILQ